jgi:hypothetical protein
MNGFTSRGLKRTTLPCLTFNSYTYFSGSSEIFKALKGRGTVKSHPPTRRNSVKKKSVKKLGSRYATTSGEKVFNGMLAFKM